MFNFVFTRAPRLCCLFTVAVLVIFGLPILTHAQESIQSFDVHIEIFDDSSYRVTETITYDFGEQEKHGIFRTIPTVQNLPDTKYATRIELRDFNVKRTGQRTTSNFTRSEDEVSVRIGDPQIFIRGVHEYIISYVVHGGLSYYDDFDELYWNVPGDEWEVPIRKASVSVVAPGEIIQFDCFEGVARSNQACKGAQESSGVSYTASTENLAPGEGMTIAVAFPKDIVPIVRDIVRGSGWATGPLAQVLMAGFALFLVFVLRRRNLYLAKKSKTSHGTVVTRFEPPKDVSPIMVSLLDGPVNPGKIFSSALIYFAQKGLLKIEYGKSDFSSTAKKIQHHVKILGTEFPGGTVFETTLWKILVDSAQDGMIDFGNTTQRRALKTKLYGLLKTFPKTLGNFGYSFTVAGNFERILGAVFAVAGFVGVANSFHIGASLIFMFGGMITIPRNPIRKASNTRTKEVVAHLSGYKHYLSVAEKERLDFHNSPAKTPEEFFKHLPYVIALGVESQWQHVFDVVEMPNPDWYSGPRATVGSNTMTPLLRTLSDVGRSISPARSRGSSRSSGSSGGGSSSSGGGGGGGSW